MEFKHVNGEKRGDVLLYALSTCGWCKKTKKFLEDLGVDYQYVFVDKLNTDEKVQATNEIKKWNPRCSFPTLVINNEKCIIGFQDDEIKETLGYG